MPCSKPRCNLCGPYHLPVSELDPNYWPLNPWLHHPLREVHFKRLQLHSSQYPNPTDSTVFITSASPVPLSESSALNALNPVLNLRIQLLQPLNVLLRSIPVTTPIRLKECGHHVTEGIRVGVQKPLLHLRIIDEGVIRILKHKVVNLSCSRRPSHGVPQTLLDLTHTLITSRKHTLVELGVQQLGAGIKTDSLSQSPHLSIGSGRVSHQRHGLLLVITQTLHNLRGVRVIVVGHISDGNLRGIQVLEGHINILQSRLEQIRLLLHHARLVSIEGKALPGQELILQLGLILPSSILNRKTNIGTVRSSRVGEHTACSLTQRHIQLLSLLKGVLAHKVLLQRLIRLSGHLDTTVQQVHLVDEQVTEHSRARHNHINTGAAKLLKRNELHLVHTAKTVSHRTDTNKGKHLSQRLAIGLDVVSAPQSEGNGLREGTIILILQLLKKLANHSLRHFNSCSGGDGRGVKCMHVPASGKDIRVTDGVATRGRHEELSIEKLHDATKLIVGNHLLQAELKVVDHRGKTLLLHLGEPSINDGLSPGLLGSNKATKEASHLIKHVLHLLHTASGVSGLGHKGAHSSTASLHNLGV
mmetsp:Transcript_11210/g.23518  ORF Transcript_11210/g.23518 Transcript_11210/m.23518 type:complete len:586 (+) Transcript_11210:381-2138(+)